MYIKFIDTGIYGKIIETYKSKMFLGSRWHDVEVQGGTYIEKIYDDMFETVSEEEYLAAEVMDG